MKAYHEAWLKKHPNRTRRWLQEKIRDGFDVHHVDGNHKNNAPDNLALIETDDHLRLHGSGLRRMFIEAEERAEKRRETGRQIYERRATPMAWKHAGLPFELTVPAAISMAKEWAVHAEAPWPPVDNYNAFAKVNREQANLAYYRDCVGEEGRG